MRERGREGEGGEGEKGRERGRERGIEGGREREKGRGRGRESIDIQSVDTIIHKKHMFSLSQYLCFVDRAQVIIVQLLCMEH